MYKSKAVYINFKSLKMPEVFKETYERKIYV